MIENYYETINSQFRELINREKKSSSYGEQTIHQFICENPTCLLGTVMNGKVDGYYLYGDSIFSKISIGNWETRIPDFIIITYNSLQITFNLIEIEAPNRKIFTNQNDFTADFNHSFTQLEDWNRLFPTNANEMTRKMITSCFSDIGIYNGSQAITSKYILIYGSSEEYSGQEIKIQRLNQKFENAGFHYSSYDRLIRNFIAERGIYTLKYNSTTGGFTAIGCTPYLNYPLERRRVFGRIEEKESLIIASSFLEPDQKEQLLSQMEALDKTAISKLEEDDLGVELISDLNKYD